MKVKIYSAKWCTGCGPHIQKAQELCNDVEVVNIDDISEDERQNLGFMSVPITFIYDDDGNVVDRFAGSSVNKLKMYLEE